MEDLERMTLLLSHTEMELLLNMREVIEIVEEAFREKGLGRYQMPPKVYMIFEEYEGDLRAMPAYVMGYAGVKIVNSHPRNPERGFPTVMGILVLNSPETGFPLAIMDATLLTSYRTAAASAVATKYLARDDSSILGIIGAGTQGRFQLLGLMEVMDVDRVLIWDISEDRADRYVREMSEKTDLDISVAGSPRDVCRCDVLVTATPARSPIVRNEWIEDGTHINAIGADGPGKQELDPEILRRSKVVVDDLEQAIHGGEINVPISEGLFSPDAVYGELGEIVAGLKPGRTSREEVTVFDSTGLAIQDVATAKLVYEKALREGRGIRMRLVQV